MSPVSGCTCWTLKDRMLAGLEGVQLDERPCAIHDADARTAALREEAAEHVAEFNRLEVERKRAEAEDALRPPSLRDRVMAEFGNVRALPLNASARQMADAAGFSDATTSGGDDAA